MTYHMPKRQQACHTDPSATLLVTNTQVCQQNLQFTISSHLIMTSCYAIHTSHFTCNHPVNSLPTCFIISRILFLRSNIKNKNLQKACMKMHKLKSDQQINNWTLNYDRWITGVVCYCGSSKEHREGSEITFR